MGLPHGTVSEPLDDNMDQANQIQTAQLIHSLSSQKPKAVVPSRVVQRRSATLSARFWTRNIAKRPLGANPTPRTYRRLVPRLAANPMTGPQLEHSVKQPSSATSLAVSLSRLHRSQRNRAALKAGRMKPPRRDAKSGSRSMKVSRMLFGNQYL